MILAVILTIAVIVMILITALRYDLEDDNGQNS